MSAPETRPVCPACGQINGEHLAHCLVKSMNEKIIALWMLLDDIDTLDDMCKGNDSEFRKRAYAKQRARFLFVSGEEIDALRAPRIDRNK